MLGHAPVKARTSQCEKAAAFAGEHRQPPHLKESWCLFQMPFNFPALPGLSWSVHKRPSFSTRVASHVSGREVRLPFYAVTLYEFELTIEGMDSNGAYPGLGVNSLPSLMGLYIKCQGQFGTFLYIDPTDNAVTGQAIAGGIRSPSNWAGSHYDRWVLAQRPNFLYL
jgi:Conserved hypothetical protein 2217 (DUF2460)